MSHDNPCRLHGAGMIYRHWRRERHIHFMHGRLSGTISASQNVLKYYDITMVFWNARRMKINSRDFTKAMPSSIEIC